LREGLVDVFRDRRPDLQEFSYFGRRFGRKGRGHGWRSDYFLASRAIDGSIADSLIEASPAFSDHVPIVLLADRAIVAGDPPVAATLITVLNTDETLEPAPPAPEPERPKRPNKINDIDMEAIRAERRTTGRDTKPIIRKDFEEGDERPAKKAKVNFDEEEYGKAPRKKKANKKPKPK
jgi:hypothetical protein